MERFAAAFVILGAVLWGIDGIVLRPSLYHLPVPLVVFVESGLITLLLSPMFWRQRHQIRLLKRKDWLAFLAVAVFGGVIGTMSITKALFYVNFVNLSIVVLIQKLQPVVAIILAAVLLKERPQRAFYFWAFCAILGAYVMTFGNHLPVWDASNKMLEAVLFALLAVVGFAASTVFSKRALRHTSFTLATYLRFSLTAAAMLLVVLATGNLTKFGAIQPENWLVFFTIAIMTGGPAIFFYYYGLKRITASVATICELAFPLTAVVLEYWLRGNILSWVQWGGVVLLVYSIIRISKISE
jgi:drug/metabolite transporter (DMT)-like permease